MAFVNLRSVGNALITSSVISRFSLRSRGLNSLNAARFYTSINRGRHVFNEKFQLKAIFDRFGQINSRNITAISPTAEDISDDHSNTASIIGTSTSETHKLTRFKRKALFLQHLQDKLSTGHVLKTNEAFGLLKSCGPRMVGETDKTRNELVTYVWEELEKNGVELSTGLWNTLLSVYVENRHDFEPLEFLKRLREKSNMEPNKTTFSLLIQAYAVQGNPAGAMKIVEFMMNNNDVRMTEHVYAWLIQAFAKKGDMQGVEEILKAMQDGGIRPRRSTFSHLVEAHAERGDLENIDKTIEEMIEKQLYPSSETYLGLLDHLSLGGHSDLIPEVWKRIESIESLKEDVKPLIQKYITRGDYRSALALLLCSTVPISNKRETYNRFIERRLFNNICFSEKDFSEYLVVLELMEKHLTVKPLSRLNNLIYFLINEDQPETALQVLNKVINDGNKVTAKNIHPIFKHYGENMDLNGIVNTFKFMENKNIAVDFYCYKNIEPALGEPGSEQNFLFLSKIKDVYVIFLSLWKPALPFPFTSMGEGLKNVELPTTVVTRIIDNDNSDLHQISEIVASASTAGLFSSLQPLKKALLEHFNPDDAAKIVATLHNRGMKDITVLIDEIMTSLVNQDEKAHDALEFLKLLMENSVPISSHSYTKMLKKLHSSGMSDQFFMFVRLMKEHGIDPDVHQYYQMLKMAATVGNSMAAQFCFDKVIESDAFPSNRNELYEYLIKAYGRDTENTQVIPSYLQGKESENALKVVSLFEEMKQLNYRPSAATITMVIRSHLLNLDIDGANAVIEEYGEGKEQLRKTVKNSFMRAYVAKKDFKAAEDFFSEMKEQQLVTSLQYNEMMRICEAAGDTEKVEALYKEMIDNGHQTNVFTHLHRIRTFIARKQPEPCIDILEESIATAKNTLRVDLFMIVLRHLVPTGNVANVQRVIDLIKEHHASKVPPKRLAHALSLVHIKAGNIEEASKLLPTTTDDPEESMEIELNPYRKAAKTASLEGDIGYIDNIMKFLKANGLHYQTLDTFYLLALNKTGNKDGIRQLYRQRIEENFTPNEKFMSLINAILGEDEVAKIASEK